MCAEYSPVIRSFLNLLVSSSLSCAVSVAGETTLSTTHDRPFRAEGERERDKEGYTQLTQHTQSTHTYTHTNKQTDTHKQTLAYKHKHTYAHTCTHANTHTTHTHINKYTHTHTQKQTNTHPGGKAREIALLRASFRRDTASISPAFLARLCRFSPLSRRISRVLSRDFVSCRL